MGLSARFLTGGPDALRCSAQVVHPVVHQRTPSREQIAARARRLGLIAHDVSECSFGHLARMVRPFRGPVPEARSEAVGHRRADPLAAKRRADLNDVGPDTRRVWRVKGGFRPGARRGGTGDMSRASDPTTARLRGRAVRAGRRRTSAGGAVIPTSRNTAHRWHRRGTHHVNLRSLAPRPRPPGRLSSTGGRDGKFRAMQSSAEPPDPRPAPERGRRRRRARAAAEARRRLDAAARGERRHRQAFGQLRTATRSAARGTTPRSSPSARPWSREPTFPTPTADASTG